MLISGVDQARVSGDQIRDRSKLASNLAERVASEPASAQNSLDRDSQNALMRFARFLNQDGKKKPKKDHKRSAHLLYRANWDREQALLDRGQLINVLA